MAKTQEHERRPLLTEDDMETMKNLFALKKLTLNASVNIATTILKTNPAGLQPNELRELSQALYYCDQIIDKKSVF